MSQKPTAAGASAQEAALQQAEVALANFVDLGLSEGKKAGAEATKVSAGATFEQRLVVEAGEFTLANSLESRSVGIAVHKNARRGSASSNSSDPKTLSTLVQGAMALASYSIEDPYLCMASAKDAPKAKPLAFQFDPALASVDLTYMEKLMQEGLAILTKDPRILLERFEMAVNLSASTVATSLGMRQAEKQSMLHWSFMGMARENDEVTGFDYDSGFSYALSGSEQKLFKEAKDFVARLLAGLHPKKAPSYKGAVLLTPRAVQELLVGMITYHAGGRQVMDGKSLWENRLGQRVMSRGITLSDAPHDQRYSGATAYDADGLPTKDLVIIDDGVLCCHLHDLYSAKRLSGQGKPAQSTATAGGPFALSFAPGATRLRQLVQEQEQLVVVGRFSGNSDPVKGDFSGVAKASRLWRRGEDLGPLQETMIAGNFFDIAEKVIGISQETEIVSGGFSSPYILLDGVSVTGN